MTESQNSDKWSLIWLDDTPGAADFAEMVDDVVLRLGHRATPPPPSPPQHLLPWFEGEPAPMPDDGPPIIKATYQPQIEVEADLEQWMTTWEQWADSYRSIEANNRVYGQLAQVARDLEQQDDERELMLSTGLVTLVAEDGREIRRHLLAERVVPTIDGRRSTVTVRRVGNPVQVEHRELFEELESYVTDRAEAATDELLSRADDPHSLIHLDKVADCLSVCLGAEASIVDHGKQPRSPSGRFELSHSPALVVRPRTQLALAEAYRKIGNELSADGSLLSVGLSQLVVNNVDAQLRQHWIERDGGRRGLDLGEDPLFPLPTNDEQRQVMDLLSRETSVVVQGPPGTGKTHTIANLISALLAQGQRVLVTSQKEQALRVLRDKIPVALRPLCVLLAGGSRNSAEEVQNGLEALAHQLAAADQSRMAAEAQQLQSKRHQLKAESARLNSEIRDLRVIEQIEFDPSESGLDQRFRGQLGQIVGVLNRERSELGWIPPSPTPLPEQPPLTTHELNELHRFHSAALAHRALEGRWVPGPDEVPTESALIELIELENQLTLDEADQGEALAQQLATLSGPQLGTLRQAAPETHDLVNELADRTAPDQEWLRTAVDELFGGRRETVWRDVLDATTQLIAAEAASRQHPGEAAMVEPLSPSNLPAARQAVAAGAQLVALLESGGRIKKRFASAEQKQATPFLQMLTVDGGQPHDLATTTAGLARLRAEVAGVIAVEGWEGVGASIDQSRAIARLSDLQDKHQQLSQVFHVVELQRTIGRELATAGHPIRSFDDFALAVDAANSGARRQEAETARSSLRAPLDKLRLASREKPPCNDLTELLAAADRLDPGEYARCRQRLMTAAENAVAARQFDSLIEQVRTVHPPFADLLATSVGDEVWAEQASRIDEAWQWARARAFVDEKRNVEAEQQLTKEFTAAENELQRATEQLAATRALMECQARITDEQAQALKEFQVNQANIGAGKGKKAKQLRRAAQDSMRRARPAVPAWVVPLPNLLDNLPVERDSFDVVIVDEASQVGMENLFLLWLAPRVIVVGDDKQCSPGLGRLGKTNQVFTRLDQYLGDVELGTRSLFTADNNLYDLLTARSGKESVIRLREHFRCMPEIINYSSNQFYEVGGAPGLIPLRERATDDLEPLKLEYIEDGHTEGRNASLHNRPEAEAIARAIRECLDDPDYEGMTFGVVVLKSTAQKHLRLLETLINEKVSTEERETRKIRVGIPSAFQGDERDVIMLSMVDSGTPNAINATGYRQAYNVAASRARNQMWLFTSLRKQDLKEDLRYSLIGYMQDPPSVFGASPSLDEVSEDDPTPGFDSLLEQRIFREMRRRGYHVVPQYEVGSRSLDLVVVGADGQRLAVECDGHYWHSSIEQTDADARRDRELARMGWQVLRIRESEFELDRERALAPLWVGLDRRNIHPLEEGLEGQAPAGWEPVELPEEAEGRGLSTEQADKQEESS